MTIDAPGRAPSGSTIAVSVLAVVLCAPAPPSAETDDPARAFLARHFGLGQADFGRLDQGHVVAHSMPAADGREVATRGVVHIRVHADLYLARLADIVAFKRHEAVLQIGVFSDRPVPGDLRGLTLESRDVRDLRSCRPGGCDLKLSAAIIERFQREVRWTTPDAEREANALMREVLAGYVADVRRRGDAAAMQYAHQRTPVDGAAEFRALLASDGGLLQQFPALARFVLTYPAGGVEGVREVFYWSKEKPGPSPVVTITQLVMASPGGAAASHEGPVRHAVLSRQIYGSRYFDASMGLTLLLPDTRAAVPSTYVVYVNRSRLDVFSGLFGGIIRRTVRSRVRSGLAESLARIKAAMEQPTAEPAGGPLHTPW